MPSTLIYNGHTVTLTPQPDGSYRAQIDGETLYFRAERQPDGGWLLIMDERRTIGYAAASGTERYVSVNGDHYMFRVADGRTTRRRSTSGVGDLSAQMPGKVVDVRVQAGDSVEQGQTLIILEAMKMEIRVSAPVVGRVKRVLAHVGDIVERGQTLLELE